MRPIDYLAVAQPPWECKLPWGQRSLTALQHFPHCWASPIAPTTRRIGNSLNTDCNPTVERKLQSPTVMFPANHFSMSHQSTLPLMRRLPRSVRLPQPRNQLICPAPILYPFRTHSVPTTCARTPNSTKISSGHGSSSQLPLSVAHKRGKDAELTFSRRKSRKADTPYPHQLPRRRSQSGLYSTPTVIGAHSCFWLLLCLK